MTQKAAFTVERPKSRKLMQSKAKVLLAPRVTLEIMVATLCILVGQPLSVSTSGGAGSAPPMQAAHHLCSLLVLRGGDGIDGIPRRRESARVGMSAGFLPPRSDEKQVRTRNDNARGYVPGPLGEVPAPDPAPRPREQAARKTVSEGLKLTDPLGAQRPGGSPSPLEQFNGLRKRQASTHSAGGTASKNMRVAPGTNTRHNAPPAALSALDTIRARLLQLHVDNDKGSHSLDSKEERSEDTAEDIPWNPDRTAAAGRKRPPRSATNNKLTADQERALEAVKKGHNIFLTGSAGTGKSFVLRHLIGALKRRHGNNAVHVTASTGAAAVLIGGTTLHAFAGIGLGKEDAATLVKKVYANKLTSGRWQRARALVIDEVSMIDCDLFEKIDYVARQLKTPNRAFGGLQLIVCGDFFQLPPVSAGSGGVTGPKRFAFQSKAWERAVQETVELKRVMRQGEEKFVRVLNELRWGKVSYI